MKYLFIGAHTDDIELSCGGTIAMLKEHGNVMNIITFSQKYNGINLKHEWEKSLELIQPYKSFIYDFPVRHFKEHRQDILDILVGLKGYDYIFTHTANDFHQDHSVIGEESIRAFRSENLITYKGEWNGELNKNYFVHLDEKLMYKKMVYLDCYRSQENRPYMSSEIVYATALNNGLKCKTKYAEAFEIIHMNL